jgi:hypothetical protein
MYIFCLSYGTEEIIQPTGSFVGEAAVGVL